ncbi:IPT/TIG domain-containing protein [Thermoleophilum album]|uniref:IPT/TIG domain-containing protein n=1 Tax=Thermoleophilum album TaxID=29539 RepID=A0A1H6FTI7_THEAL|nr:IPT/TIG domain-containing protein [Thermoleophilum album]SEH14136.1 IPT/TIG domain-containing protein [Thermoleophilum album]
MRARKLLRLALIPASLLAIAAPAQAARKPVVTSVSPMRVTVGGTITIKGRNFSARASRNTVILRGSGGKTAFLKPRSASSRKLVVVVPRRVAELLAVANGQPRATRMSLRIAVSRSFSKWTPRRLSPVVAPASSGGSGGGGTSGGSAGGAGGGTAQTASCSGDADGDLLDAALEAQLKTDPCVADTDRDGISDGYEYKSAVDLNNDDYQSPNASLPYPGKRPYPNPLDPTDANVDHDGDGLTLAEEFGAWNYTIANGSPRTLFPLSYSAGEKYSILSANDPRSPGLPAAGYGKWSEFLAWASSAGYRNVTTPDGTFPLLDLNHNGTESVAEQQMYDLDGNGWLSDEERDEDADGLTNFDETHGRMLVEYWKACYASERPYYLAYSGTDFLNPDGDGDGVRDGADDQDHDDVPNLQELSRIGASGIDDRKNGKNCVPADGLPTPPATHHAATYGRVNPFNPCLPFTGARTCNTHPGVGQDVWAPFDDSPNWYSLQ